MKWSVGRQISPHGAGLGNEIFPWAKAHIGAVANGAAEVEPAWRLGPYSFGDDLRGTYRSALRHNVTSHVIPHADFDAADYLATGCIDYAQALQAAISAGALDTSRPVVRHTSRMAGGYLGIASARDYLRSRLLGGADAQRSTDAVRSAGDHTITLGIHVRRGDFAATPRAVEPGAFNATMPLPWFINAARDLATRAELPVTVVLASDDPSLALDPLDLGTDQPVLRPGASALGDLAALAACDVVLPSISSFSMLALFLGSARYAWPREHLHREGDWLSIWGGEAQGWGQIVTAQNATHYDPDPAGPRGVPLAVGEPWPDPLVADLSEGRSASSSPARDLIYYGVVPT